MYHPGASEIQWLTDLKSVAERVGREVLGFDIVWNVENLITGDARRPDVIVRDAQGGVLFSGEAKRPDTPEGAHALVSSEVDDALSKAHMVGASFCFTTNFLEIALFSATSQHSGQLELLQGNPIPVVSASLATAPQWWTSLDRPTREQAVEHGLRQFFSRYKTAAAGETIPVSIDQVVLSFLQTLTERIVESQYPPLLAARNANQIPADVSSHALRVALDLNEDLNCRFLVAQGVAEVLTAALFYHSISEDFGVEPLSVSVNAARVGYLDDAVVGALARAMEATGDYETIFRLTPAALWLMDKARAESFQHWKSLLSFVAHIDTATLDSDVLGTIFERLIEPERRHQMGQHYTQPRLASSMSKWAIRAATDVVLDPACGAGTFLVEAYKRFKELQLTHQECLGQVFGNDLDPFAVHLATVNLATREVHEGANYPAVRLGDAFDIRKHSEFLNIHPLHGGEVKLDLPDLTVVLGNPPYGRSLDDDTAAATALQKLLSIDARDFLGGANIAAWFLALAMGLVETPHRIALVMPAAVLQNENLIAWRRWLRKSWNAVVWYTEVDVWFSEARVATCVLLLESRSGSGSGSLKFVNVMEAVSGDLHSSAGIAAPAAQCHTRDLSTLDPSADILIPGAAPDVLLSFAALPNVSKLGEMEDIGVLCSAGTKLGHKFYKLTDLAPDRDSVKRPVRGLGMDFSLPRRYLRPLLDTPKALSTGSVSATDTWLLAVPKESPTNANLKAYVAHAKRLAVNDQPSVKNRGRYWWSIDPDLCRIAVPMNSAFQHQVGWFEQPGIANNNFNVIEFQLDSKLTDEDEELIAASLASAFGALSRLYVSGVLGCEGARRLLLSQFVQWSAVNPHRATDSAQRTKVLDSYREFRGFASDEMDEMDATTLRVWKELTTAVAALAGSPMPEDAAMEAVRECQLTVSRRRAWEAAAVGGRPRGRKTGAGLAKRVQEQLDASPSFIAAVELLSSGSEVITLRTERALSQGSLWEETASNLAVDSELELTRRIGPDFECAPPSDEERDSWRSLIAALDTLTRDVPKNLLGKRPSASERAARQTWDEAQQRIAQQLRKQLQRAVREQLY